MIANHSLSSDEIFRYSRQINLKEIGLYGQEKLKNARVLCVGLGGLGSSLLLYLAAAGVGRLGLVDSDTLELSNLQRQVLYRQSQICYSKIASASEQIHALNLNIQIDTYCEKFTENNATQLVSQYDIVADCSDNFYTNYLIHDVCFMQRKPYVYASVSQFQGYCSFFNGMGPCLRCIFPTPDPKLSPTCNESGILGVVPGILGAIQATEVLKWILGGIKHANNTSLTKGYTNILEKYRHLDKEKHAFLVMNFEENHTAQLKAIKVIENPMCRIFEINVTKPEVSIQDFDEGLIEFENLEFEDDVYIAEKRKGGLNSYQRNQPFRIQVQALCKEELAKGNYPSALQLCQRIASRMFDEYPKLLSSFEPNQNHRRTGQDWTKPTFYEWCNTEYKSFKSKSKMITTE